MILIYLVVYDTTEPFVISILLCTATSTSTLVTKLAELEGEGHWKETCSGVGKGRWWAKARPAKGWYIRVDACNESTGATLDCVVVNADCGERESWTGMSKLRTIRQSTR